MAEQARPAGSIYDLGYRPYDGERLGRSYAITSLLLYSLRAIFGLGRSAWSKVFAFGLAALALFPACVQLAIAAVSPVDFEFIRPEDNFAYIQVVLALFCAQGAPEILGRDQRHHTLGLYFSRALSRADYVTSKLISLCAALFAITALPLVLLVVGGAVADEDVLGYLQDNLHQFPPILASSLIIAAFMASVSLAIAAQTPRRAFSTGAVIGYFIIATAVGAILVNTVTGDAQRFAILLSPFDTLFGAIRWLFDAPPPEDSNIAKSGLEGGYYLLACLGYTFVATVVLYRRFLRMSV